MRGSTLMVLIDLVFHYGGEWIRKPKLFYSENLIHKWEGYDSDFLSFIDIVTEYNATLGFVGVQQLFVSVPCGKLYEIEDDEEIRTLLSLVNDKFDVINLFVVEDCDLYIEVENIIRHKVIEECDLDVNVENIVRHKESVLEVDESDSDCYNSDTGNEEVSDYSDYDSEELEFIAKERKSVVNEQVV
ncbi:hypothetical protein HAX54_047335 [Datura stramonium]|uniref:PB1-like domain-containing protein n=1 Tax=Datura stramonium TaxID=4076 RepID=A0ABS8SU22_DATST|nr:hypothetical protein [Datura stramonium]